MCHVGVRDSSQTSDVMMPKVNLCRDCHAQQDVKGIVKSECVECHSYHDSLEFDDKKRREIRDILALAN